jgi:hypothetical protein
MQEFKVTYYQDCRAISIWWFSSKAAAAFSKAKYKFSGENNSAKIESFTRGI